MRLLLDTHIVFWSVAARGKLPANARALLESNENDALVSVATAWEIAIKVGKGKWSEAADFLRQFEGIIDQSGLS